MKACGKQSLDRSESITFAIAEAFDSVTSSVTKYITINIRIKIRLIMFLSYLLIDIKKNY